MFARIQSEIKLLTSSYRSTFLVAISSYLFVYGFELTHFTLSIDEEYFDNFIGTVSFGRWGHALLRQYVLPEPYVPFFTTAISLVLLSACATISARLIGLKGVSSVCFALLFAGLPQAAYQLSFSNQSDTVSIAFLFSAVAVYFTRNLSALGFLALSFILVIPASIYQSVVFYSASLLLLSLLMGVITNGYGFRYVATRLLFMFLAMVVAVVINSIMAKVIQSHYGVESSDYLTNMILWGRREPLYLSFQLCRMVFDAFTFNNYTGLNGFSLTLISFVSIAALSIKNSSRWMILMLVAAVAASPFFLPFLTGTELSPRTSTQFPLVFAGLTGILIHITSTVLLPVVFSVVFLACGASTSNKLFYSDYMARESDVMNASRMMTIAHQKFPDFDQSKTPVFFYGSYTPANNWKVERTNVFGASFFNWDGGNNKRIYAFFSVANIADLKKPSNAQKESAIRYAKSQPSWPSSDSVMMTDGVLVIKLGDKLNKYNW